MRFSAGTEVPRSHWLALPEDGDCAVTAQRFPEMLTPAPSKFAKAPGRLRS